MDAWNLACNSLGAIWVPMYTNQNRDICNHVIGDSGASLCITEYVEKSYINTKLISNKIGDISDSIDSIDYVDNDIATLIYTSGTTGNPKGVMLSNENIVSNVKAIRSRFQNMPNTVNILPCTYILANV